MVDQWMTSLELQINMDQFRILPRHPSYRYERIEGKVFITPRPRFYHAVLDLSAAEFEVPEVTIAPLKNHWDDLPLLFVDSFSRYQPFAGIHPDKRLESATAALERSRDGGDGLFIESAAFVALEDGKPVGAVMPTLLPPGDPESFDMYDWGGKVDPEMLEQAEGWPHLTWIFVSEWCAGEGVGTALLAAMCAPLIELGYNDLLSTFLLGNESSMMWHWRAGFRLLSYPGSRRRRSPQ